MSWIQGLIAAFELANKLIDGAKALSAFYEKYKNEKWFQEYGAAISDMSREDLSEEEAKNAFKRYLRALR